MSIFAFNSSVNNEIHFQYLESYRGFIYFDSAKLSEPNIKIFLAFLCKTTGTPVSPVARLRLGPHTVDMGDSLSVLNPGTQVLSLPITIDANFTQYTSSVVLAKPATGLKVLAFTLGVSTAGVGTIEARQIHYAIRGFP